MIEFRPSTPEPPLGRPRRRRLHAEVGLTEQAVAAALHPRTGQVTLIRYQEEDHGSEDGSQHPD